MSDIRSTNIRFNIKKPEHKRAWEYLQRMDRKIFKSYTHAVVTALVSYFDKYYKEGGSPDIEAREREEQLIQRIAQETARRIVSGNMTSPASMTKAVEPSDEKQLLMQEIDWDFIGSG